MKYGTLTPPMYNLSKVTIPIVFYYGSNDFFNSLEVSAQSSGAIKIHSFDFSLPNICRLGQSHRVLCSDRKEIVFAS